MPAVVGRADARSARRGRSWTLAAIELGVDAGAQRPDRPFPPHASGRRGRVPDARDRADRAAPAQSRASNRDGSTSSSAARSWSSACMRHWGFDVAARLRSRHPRRPRPRHWPEADRVGARQQARASLVAAVCRDMTVWTSRSSDEALTKLSFDDVRSIALDLTRRGCRTADEVANTRAVLDHRADVAPHASLARRGVGRARGGDERAGSRAARATSSFPTTTSRASPAPRPNSRAAWSSATTPASTTRCTCSARAGTACPASPSSKLRNFDYWSLALRLDRS